MTISQDIDAFLERDPAAKSKLEVILCYPGFHAILIHRTTHWIWKKNFRLTARFISSIGRWFTGIEIHPAATIGERLVIDHGEGVVIGETAEIGNNVTLYQGVTLGGISPSIQSHTQRNIKRHPTLNDWVVVGAGSQIIGSIILGEGVRVGANSVVTRSIPKGAVVAGVPARIVKDSNGEKEFCPYGITTSGQLDPWGDELSSLKIRLTKMEDTNQKLVEEIRELRELVSSLVI